MGQFESISSRRVSNCMINTRQLLADIEHVNKCSKYFVGPDKKIVQFAAYHTMSNESLVDIFWRFRDNVVVLASRVLPDAKADPNKVPDANEHQRRRQKSLINRTIPPHINKRPRGNAGTYRVLGLREFYSLYLFIGDNVNQLHLLETKAARRREEKLRLDEDLPSGVAPAETEPLDQKEGRPNLLCSICVEREMEVVLQCMHAFCKSCINEWTFKFKKTSCPICRATADSTSPETWVFESGLLDESMRGVVMDIMAYPHKFLSSKPMLK